MTAERPHVDRGATGDDVARARAGVRHAGVTFGHRTSRRTVGDSWRDFADRYGWRAYALPVLIVITIAALLTSNAASLRVHATSASGHRVAPAAPPTAPPTASGSIQLKGDTGGHANNEVLRAAALPGGPSYSTSGTGTFKVLAGSVQVRPAVGTGHLYRYSIEVENGVTHIDLAQFQKLVDTTLADRRSWSGHGVSLQRVSSGHIDFRVSLTSSLTVRKLCGYTVHAETSCYAANVNRVVFNVARWVRGSTAYVGDLNAYRIYMINHEDGHALGHEHAHQCLPGGLAPVMMQQTFGLRSATTNAMCEANPWPYPTGATGAPGAEQRDTAANNEYGLAD